MGGIRTFVIAASVQAFVTMAPGAELFNEVILMGGTASDPGSRAIGLGGAYTAIADDYTASFWNPAGLAQVRRIELNGSLSQRNYRNQSMFFGNPTDASSNFTKLSNLGVVFPVPAYRGSLVFALGYNLARNWDRISSFSDPQNRGSATAVWKSAEELENGRLGFWSFATAMDLSPNVSLGAALQYWIGRDEYTISGLMWDSTWSAYASAQQEIATDLRGWRGNMGVLFRAGSVARLGLVILSPVVFDAREDWTAGDSSGYWEYRIGEPFTIRGGASVSFGRVLAAVDLDWMDWAQIEYKSEPPMPDYNEATANIALRRDFRSTLGIHGGAEVMLPFYGLKARAGGGYDPSPEKGLGSDAAQKTLAGGLGVLLDETVMVDLGYSFRWWKQSSTFLSEDVHSQTLQLSIAYRF